MLISNKGLYTTVVSVMINTVWPNVLLSTDDKEEKEPDSILFVEDELNWNQIDLVEPALINAMTLEIQEDFAKEGCSFGFYATNEHVASLFRDKINQLELWINEDLEYLHELISSVSSSEIMDTIESYLYIRGLNLPPLLLTSGLRALSRNVIKPFSSIAQA